MNRRRWLALAVRMIRLRRDPYFQGAGTQLAFYLVMSIVPLTVLLVQMCALFAITPELIGQLAEDYLSPQAVAAVKSALRHVQISGSSGAFSIATAAFTLWGASKVQYCVVGICNYARSGRVRIKGFVLERMWAVLNVVLLLSMILASLVALVYGKVILDMIGLFMDRILHLPFEFNDIWYLIRWPIAIAVYVIVISYIYFASPVDKPRFRQVLPGSVFAAVGILVASFGYSVYVTMFANFDAVYGSLASFVALLFWFYLLGTIFVLGILFNKAWEDTKYIR